MTGLGMAAMSGHRPRAALEAGPELDRAIARDVLGVEARESVPPFSTDLRAALALAGRLETAMDWSVSASAAGAVWAVTCHRGVPGPGSSMVSRAAAPTRALAICRALLELRAAEDEPTAGARPPARRRRLSDRRADPGPAPRSSASRRPRA